MHYTTIPQTDLNVSRIAMGCWAIAGQSTWGAQDERQAVEGVQAALDHGINFFDTAPAYGDGRSERLVAEGLAGRREEAVIATKLRPHQNRPEQVFETVDQSLDNLDTDRIDLLQIHWPNWDVPISETWDALRQVRDQGKARHLGVCNFGPRDLRDLLTIETPAVNQLPYNLLFRAIEHEVLPLCREHEIGVLCYSPLLLGLLTGKWMDGDEVPGGRTRTRHFNGGRPEPQHGEAGCEDETFTALNELRTIAERLDAEPADVAVAWLLHQPGVTSVLTGIRNPRQAERNPRAAELDLSRDVLDELERISDPVKHALGDNLDMWETADQSRIR